jgi:uncharacterized protein (TIGR02594 family)
MTNTTTRPNHDLLQSLPPKASASSGTKLAKKSRYAEPIQHAPGAPAGISRDAGNVSGETRQVIVGLLVDEATRRGHDIRDIAYLLLIARVESGFNPDAASTSTSASGVMQITDVTAKDIQQVTSEEKWKKSNPFDFNIDAVDSSDRFDARKNIVAGIIQFERAKVKAMARARSIERAEIEPLIYQYYHAGLYFDKNEAGKIDVDGRALFNQQIAPSLDKVEAALKKPAKLQVQLKQPDGKPYPNANFAAIVPKKAPVATVATQGKPAAPTPSPAASPHAPQPLVSRIFEEVWRRLKREWAAHTQVAQHPRTAGPQQQTAPSHSTNKLAPTPPEATSVKTASTASAPATPKPHPDTPKLQALPEAVEQQSAPCIDYPIRVQDADDFEVVFGKTDANGLSDMLHLERVGEVQFFLLGEASDFAAPAALTPQPASTAETTPPEALTDASTTPANATEDSPQATTASQQTTQSAEPVTTDESAGAPAPQPPTPPIDKPSAAPVSGLYAQRTPALESAMAKLANPLSLGQLPTIEYARSYICKAQEVVNALGDGRASTKPSADSHVVEITASSKAEPRRPKEAVAQVATKTENANATAQSQAPAPWMDIAMKERANGCAEVPGSPMNTEAGKALVTEIKAAGAQLNRLKTELAVERRKHADRTDPKKLESLKVEINKSESELTEQRNKLIALENDPSVNNPRIIEYLAATSIGRDQHRQYRPVDDQTNWCGAFVSWCLQQAGIQIPKGMIDARAIEWADFGKEVDKGSVGAIVVVHMGPGDTNGVRSASNNHVGFLIGEGEDRGGAYLLLLGGNQRYDAKEGTNSKHPRVSISKLKIGVTASVVSRRWPN